MQTIYIDISNKSVLPTIYAKQGEVGRKFEVVLTDAGVPYNVESGILFSVWYEGSSGEGNYTEIGEKSAFSISGNRVIVELITQMLVNPGCGTLCLVMNKGANQIGVWNIHYSCEKNPGFDSEEAQSYYTAFSEAVEKLASPDTTLSIMGAPADAKSTGDALSKKAPAGYGLGSVVQDITAPALDNTTGNGWYRIAGQSLTVGGYTYSDWYIHVSKYSNSNLVQEMYTLNGYKAVRWCQYGTWYEEWENPPMELGVEYRTTERYKGKPVYRKLVSYTNSNTVGTEGSSTSISIPHGISKFGELVRVTGKQSGSLLPYLTSSGRLAMVSTVSTANIFVDTNTTWTSRNWEFDIAYTKND